LTAQSPFPTQNLLIEALTLILENSCLFGDLVLHFPDQSSKILKESKDWKETANWSIKFSSAFGQILDSKSIEILSLFRQEIDENVRSNDYVNPYRQPMTETKGLKKQKKKLSKGPQLSGRNEL
jgi:hypothetical protein